MDKIQRDIEQLEKESTETTNWKTGMEDLLMSFKSALEKFTGLMEGINNNQTALNETIAMLSKKMEKHIASADSFKAQVVKHQVSSKTESEAIQKKLTKAQQQLDAMNRKFAQEIEETRRIKDELKTKMDATGERISSTDAKLQQLQTEFETIKAKVDDIHNSAQSSINSATSNSTPVQFIPEWMLRERKKNNIIIFGQQETDDDLALIKLLAGDLDLDLQLTFFIYFALEHRTIAIRAP